MYWFQSARVLRQFSSQFQKNYIATSMSQNLGRVPSW